MCDITAAVLAASKEIVRVTFNGKAAKGLDQPQFTPDLAQTVDYAKRIIGNAGNAFRFFAFADVPLSPCSARGSVVVRYGGEAYRYQLPAPGCAGLAR